jgi:hypothetical protein
VAAVGEVVEMAGEGPIQVTQAPRAAAAPGTGPPRKYCLAGGAWYGPRWQARRASGRVPRSTKLIDHEGARAAPEAAAARVREATARALEF